MNLEAGYNWGPIVIINVALPVGRPKTFDPSIATYVALKGAPSPKVLEALSAERTSSKCASCGPHLSALGLLTIGCKL